MKKFYKYDILVITIIGFILGYKLIGWVNNSRNINSDINYRLVRITDTPEGWTVGKYDTFYYDIDTYIIYFGKSFIIDKNEYDNVLELKSAEYRNYVYDKETGNFIGVD
jgi:hypothetical protein